jgi:mono/diheme cytochrome c family protein
MLCVGALSRARISSKHATLLTALALTCSAALANARTTADGVYTAEQAETGKALQDKHCARCHHYSYYQGAFLLSWQQTPVSALYDIIELKMPQDRPGSLKPREYAAILAYIFELNELPPGDEKLSAERDELGEILITGSE